VGSGYSGLVCTIIPSKTGVKLGIVGSARFPDPKGLLEGAGKLHRYVQFTEPAALKRAGIKPLLTAARAAAISQRGYAMAALLVSIGVLMVIMAVAMPVWRTQAQREKEAELIFRGEQYARAVNLYTRKMGPGNFPPSIDVLVQQRFLRKKYKDPMTPDGEFEIITAASAAGQPGVGRGNQPPQPSGRGGAGPSTGLSAPPSSIGAPGGRGQTPSPFGGIQGPPLGQSPFGQAGGGGIMGVRSKSKETSFRVYNGATHYNEWSFLFANVSNRPGARGGAGRPGGPGQMPGQGGPFISTPDGGRGPGGRGPGGGGNTPRGFGPGIQPGIGRGRG
jgi:type II secretory pathway pseudopilin PulG